MKKISARKFDIFFLFIGLIFGHCAQVKAEDSKYTQLMKSALECVSPAYSDKRVGDRILSKKTYKYYDEGEYFTIIEDKLSTRNDPMPVKFNLVTVYRAKYSDMEEGNAGGDRLDIACKPKKLRCMTTKTTGTCHTRACMAEGNNFTRNGDDYILNVNLCSHDAAVDARDAFDLLRKDALSKAR